MGSNRKDSKQDANRTRRWRGLVSMKTEKFRSDLTPMNTCQLLTRTEAHKAGYRPLTNEIAIYAQTPEKSTRERATLERVLSDARKANRPHVCVEDRTGGVLTGVSVWAKKARRVEYAAEDTDRQAEAARQDLLNSMPGYRGVSYVW